MKKFLFFIREFSWVCVAELEDWLYPYRDDKEPLWMKNETTNNEIENVKMELRSANNNIERLQNELGYVISNVDHLNSELKKINEKI
tara:strand:- start:361 stop:621 length:261 start_codon:yes stop_codon:yes gene_type:complete